MRLPIILCGKVRGGRALVMVAHSVGMVGRFAALSTVLTCFSWIRAVVLSSWVGLAAMRHVIYCRVVSLRQLLLRIYTPMAVVNLLGLTTVSLELLLAGVNFCLL